LDISYRRSPKNIQRVIESLKLYDPYLRGAPPGLPFTWDEQTISRGLNFTLSTSLGAIDLLGEVSGGGGYDNLLFHTITLEIFGHNCKCLDVQTLIKVKRAAGRPKDLEAIAELEAILEERQKMEAESGS